MSNLPQAANDPRSLEPDPRIYFAAERTLLAWLRTGLAVIGVGFLVARFGLFLTLVQANREAPERPFISSLIGIGFIVTGALIIAASAWQHHRFCRRLDDASKPAHYSMAFAIWISVIMAALGIALAVYLGISVFHAIELPIKRG